MSTGGDTTPLTQPVVHALPRAVAPEEAVVMMNRRPRWKLVRQQPPGAARSQEIKHRVNNIA